MFNRNLSFDNKLHVQHTGYTERKTDRTCQYLFCFINDEKGCHSEFELIHLLRTLWTQESWKGRRCAASNEPFVVFLLLLWLKKPTDLLGIYDDNDDGRGRADGDDCDAAAGEGVECMNNSRCRSPLSTLA